MSQDLTLATKASPAQ